MYLRSKVSVMGPTGIITFDKQLEWAFAFNTIVLKDSRATRKYIELVSSE